MPIGRQAFASAGLFSATAGLARAEKIVPACHFGSVSRVGKVEGLDAKVGPNKRKAAYALIVDGHRQGLLRCPPPLKIEKLPKQFSMLRS